MTRYTLQLGHAMYFGANVTVEAGTIEEACRRAIEKADETGAWRSTDDASESHVVAIEEDAGQSYPHPFSPIPVPDEYSEHGPPPVVVLTGAAPPGAIRVEGGAVRIRFETPGFAVTTEMSDPQPPTGSKPLITVSRRPDGTPHVSVRGGRARVRVTGWDRPAPVA